MSPSRKSVPSAVVGLDIGSDSIKVVEAKHAKDGITITGIGIARTPEGVIENEVIADPQALGSAIKTLLSESGIKTKKCVSSVAGQSRVVVRVVEVPKMKPEELAETMKWQVETQVPFSPDDIVMDYQPLEKPGTDPDAQNMEVLLAVAQQELIDSHIATLQAAGLQPMAIDIESLASSRAIIETARVAGRTEDIVAIVNIGNNNTDLGIFEDGLLTFPSPPLGIAGVNFTREIAASLNQAPEQAEVTKKEYAAVDLAGFAQQAVEDNTTDSAVSGSEQTSFNTSIGFDSPFTNVFTQQDAPQQPTPAEPAASDEATNTFSNTADGPVFGSGDAAASSGPAFDLGDTPAGPSFDLGGTQMSAGGPAFDLGANTESSPSFDLGDGSISGGPKIDADGSTEPASATPAFDLGGGGDDFTSEPVSPSFDLDDDEPVTQAASDASPFDLPPVDEASSVPPESAPVPAPTPGFDAGSLQGQVFASISGVLVDLANELRRTIEYFNTRYGKAPSKIYLCGGTAKMPKLDEYLSNELGVPVEVADPVKDLKIKVPGVSPQYLNEISPLLTVSIGLAIRDMIG